MLPLSRAVHLESQGLGDALPPTQVQGRGYGIAVLERHEMLTPVVMGPRYQRAEARDGVLVGCCTRALCTHGDVECFWPACAAKGRR